MAPFDVSEKTNQLEGGKREAYKRDLGRAKTGRTLFPSLENLVSIGKKHQWA